MKSLSSPIRSFVLTSSLLCVSSAWAAGPPAAQPSGAVSSAPEPIGRYVLMIGWQVTGAGALSGSDLDTLEQAVHGLNEALFQSVRGTPLGDAAAEGLVRILFGADEHDLTWEQNLAARSSVELVRALEEFDDLLDDLRSRLGGDHVMLFFIPNAMRMNVPDQSMVWGAPPSGAGFMAFADHVEKRVTRGSFLVGDTPRSSKYEAVQPTRTGATDTIAFSHAEEYEYKFKVQFGGRMMNTVNRTNGTIWVAREHPGMSIVAEFYQNYENAIRRTKFLGEVGGGLFDVLAQLSNRGLPLKGTSSSIVTSSFLGAPSAPPLPSVSAFEVVAALVLPLYPEMQAYILGGDFPEDYELIEFDNDILPDNTDQESAEAGGLLRRGFRQWRRGVRDQFTRGNRGNRSDSGSEGDGGG